MARCSPFSTLISTPHHPYWPSSNHQSQFSIPLSTVQGRQKTSPTKGQSWKEVKNLYLTPKRQPAKAYTGNRWGGWAEFRWQLTGGGGARPYKASSSPADIMALLSCQASASSIRGGKLPTVLTALLTWLLPLPREIPGYGAFLYWYW